MSVAATYAEALFQAAADKGSVAAVASDLDALRVALAPDGEIARVLYNPQVDSRAKKAAVAGLGQSADALTVNLLQVLVDRGRLEELGAITDAFAARVAAEGGEISVEVTTAVPLPDDLRAQVVQRIADQTGKTPVITERVDPEIIGGLILRVGGVMTDASVRGRLTGLRQSITRA